MVQRGSKGIPDLIRMGIFLADITLFTQINVTWSLICRLLVEINSILPGLERVVILMNLPTDLPDRRKLLRLEELDGFPPFGTWKSHFSPILGRCLQEKKLKHPLYPLKQCDFIDFCVRLAWEASHVGLAWHEKHYRDEGGALEPQRHAALPEGGA